MAQYAMAALHHDNRVDTSNIQFPTAKAAHDKSGATMKALLWKGSQDVAVDNIPRVTITDPRDAVVRVTSTTICGSDLHLYHNEMMGLTKNDILGHEAMGIVEEVGPEVREFRKGDRVVISAVISCGSCDFCKEGRMSLCECTNGSKDMEKLYGHRLGGLFGYTKLLGGYDGCQAEYVRVPICDVNLLKVPAELPEERALFLSDILCTSWHANELGEVKPGDVVCIWGAGPVGIMSAMWAKFRGAARVIVIDLIAARLAMVRNCIGVEALDRSAVDDVPKTLQELLPGGPDVCIDATAFRFTNDNLLHRVERAIGMETDAASIVNECITICKKGGRLVLIADYYSYTNHFNIGALMEKGLTLRGGQLWAQKYWKMILRWITDGLIDPTFVITHRMPISKLDDGYKLFDSRRDDVVKIVLYPDEVQLETVKVGPTTKPAILRMPTADEWKFDPALYGSAAWEKFSQGAALRGGPAMSAPQAQLPKQSAAASAAK